MTAQKNPARDHFVHGIVERYGDLIYDLCESVLWSPSNAFLAFRAILKELRGVAESSRYQEQERAWVLRISCDKLKRMAIKHGRRLTPSEQIMLDASLDVEARFQQFDSYYHRLSTEDQILLLLRDKYGLPYNEIAAATGIPEGSLKIRRQQAIRTLEEWLWNLT